MTHTRFPTQKTSRSRSFTSQSSSQLDILLLDGDTLGVDGCQIGVFKQRDQVRFNRLLQGPDGWRLEPQVCLEILRDLPDQSLEGQLSDQKFGRFLKSSDFSQRDGTWLISVWFLDTTGRWCGLSGCLGGQLLSWCFTTCGFSCCLLSSSHCCFPFLCYWLILVQEWQENSSVKLTDCIPFKYRKNRHQCMIRHHDELPYKFPRFNYGPFVPSRKPVWARSGGFALQQLVARSSEHDRIVDTGAVSREKTAGLRISHSFFIIHQFLLFLWSYAVRRPRSAGRSESFGETPRPLLDDCWSVHNERRIVVLHTKFVF